MICTILNFLNENAPAIQALAAVVTMGATIVLVIVTKRYVRLTEGLATTARGQLAHTEQVAVSRRRQLKSLVKALRVHVRTLPTSRERAAKIAQASVWDDADIIALLELAGEAGDKAATTAANAAPAFRWLKDQVAEVKAADKTKGVDWPRFPHDRWAEEMARVNDALRDLWNAANTALGENIL